MKKLLFLIGIILVGAMVQPIFVLSQADTQTVGNKDQIEALNKEIKEKQEKIKSIEKSIEAYKSKIDEKRTEAVSLSNQLGILDNRIAQVELDIDATEEILETIELEIEQLELTIEDKEKIIERQQIILGELIRTLHFQSSRKYIEILAAYDNFSDFYNRVQHLENVEKSLGQNAKAIRLVKEELEEKKDQQEQRKDKFEDLSDQLVLQKDDIKQRLVGKQDLLALVQTSELQQRTLLSNLKNQHQATLNDIAIADQKAKELLELLDQNEDLIDTEGTLLSWPVQSRLVTAYFYDPSYPYRHVFEHNAIDIATPQKTPLKAAASGYVVRAKKPVTTAYSYIMIAHAGGISTVYGHTNCVYVEEDQFVTRGEVIGCTGAAPGSLGAGSFTTGPHLHFEVRIDGIPVDPLKHLMEN